MRKASILATNSAVGMPARLGIAPWLLPSGPWQDAQASAIAAGARSAADVAAPQSGTNMTIRENAFQAMTGEGGGRPAAPSPQAQLRSWFFSGSERIRLPVAAKIALQTAGAIGGTPGSPMPPHLSPPLSAR